MQIDRRRVLIGLGAAAALGVGAVGGLYVRYLDAPPAPGFLALSAHEIEVLDAMAEAWMPPGGTPAISGRDAQVAPLFDEVLSRMDQLSRRGLKALLQVLDDATWPGWRSAFRHLPLDDRIVVLRGWIDGDVGLLRSGIVSLISLFGDAYMLHPEVAAVLGPMYRCGYAT